MSLSLSGLSVTTPAAWWALLTLGIPLLIHLFSRSRGRLVRIGHIDLVKKARKLQVTKIKLTQWLLLLLRLAIFTLAALILAGLSTAGLNSSGAATSYLTPGWIKTSSQQEFNALVNATEQDTESRFFLLKPGFPSVDREQLETVRKQASTDPEYSEPSWSLLSERLSLEHHVSDVTVYTTDYALQFGSHRPALPREVNWRITHPQQAPAADRKPTRVLIAYSMDRSTDAALITAVLETLKDHRLPNLAWESVDSARLGNEPVEADWLIHLDEEELSTAQLAGVTSPLTVLTDSSGSAVENSVQFIRLPFYPFTTFRLDRFSREIAEEPVGDTVVGGRVLLETADHKPLLREFHHGQLRLLRFYSRFNPQWNSITGQPEFPELLIQLMSDSSNETMRFANARINHANLQSGKNESAGRVPLPRRSLQGFLAAILVLLWITERWVSERKTREQH